MTQLSPYFNSREFTCHHCGKLPKDGISPALIEFLEKLRAHFGEPVTIMSGYRCKIHNRNVGGATKSQHLLGTAADIKVRNVGPSQIHTWAIANNPAGGVGRYANFTHVDVRGWKARW